MHLRAWLLTVLLVSGQWLAVAHASSHDLVADSGSCLVCVHADKLGAALPGLAPPPLLTAVAEQPLVVHASGIVSNRRSNQRWIRGPPSSPV